MKISNALSWTSAAIGVLVFVVSCALSWHISFIQTEHRIYTSGLARCYLVETPRGDVLTTALPRRDADEVKVKDRHPGMEKGPGVR